MKYSPLAKHLKEATISGDEVLSLCPFHEDSKPSFHFNVRKGLFICFACGEKGSAKKLAKKLGQVILEDQTVDGLVQAMSALQASQLAPVHKPIDERSLGRFAGTPHLYWKRKRGFTNATCRSFQLGYDPLRDELTIPYRNIYGELLGVIRRRLEDNIYPKYLYPKGVRKNLLLFGIDKVYAGEIKSVALVEGSLDAIWCWQNGIPAVASLGSSLSEEQTDLLHEAGVHSVVLLHDYDLAGRKGAFQAFRMLGDFIRITPAWDEDEFCWHEWRCGCGKHTELKAVACPKRFECRCRKTHRADPGSLDPVVLHDLVPSGFVMDDVLRFVKGMPRDSQVTDRKVP